MDQTARQLTQIMFLHGANLNQSTKSDSISRVGFWAPQGGMQIRSEEMTICAFS